MVTAPPATKSNPPVTTGASKHVAVSSGSSTPTSGDSRKSTVSDSSTSGNSSTSTSTSSRRSDTGANRSSTEKRKDQYGNTVPSRSTAVRGAIRDAQSSPDGVSAKRYSNSGRLAQLGITVNRFSKGSGGSAIDIAVDHKPNVDRKSSRVVGFDENNNIDVVVNRRLNTAWHSPEYKRRKEPNSTRNRVSSFNSPSVDKSSGSKTRAAVDSGAQIMKQLSSGQPTFASPDGEQLGQVGSRAVVDSGASQVEDRGITKRVFDVLGSTASFFYNLAKDAAIAVGF